MVRFPNCKINLGLHITAKRQDGYHDLETIFYPVPVNDCLEIIQKTEDRRQEIEGHNENYKNSSILFSSSGLTIAGTEENNLCIKAYNLLKKDFPQLPDIKMHLHKNIPMGAGLGGGSADGAFALKMLNEKFNLNLSNQQLINYALQLGSDCPFFIINKPCFAISRGEILTPIDFNLKGYQLLIVNPGIHVSTGWAFSQITPQKPQKDLRDIIQRPLQEWKNLLINDFENPVLQQYPELASLKDQLYAMGAVYVSMSGSGSSFFGIFDQSIKIDISFPNHYFTQLIQLV